jgi:uncharacterized membrane protein HdeD (DUF308 family)
VKIFSFKLTLLALVLGTAAMLGRQYLGLDMPIGALLAELAYLFLISWVVYYYMFLASTKKANTFVNYFLGMSTLRMFVSVLVGLVLGLIYRDQVATVLVVFAGLYGVFFVFDTVSLYQLAKGAGKGN